MYYLKLEVHHGKLGDRNQKSFRSSLLQKAGGVLGRSPEASAAADEIFYRSLAQEVVKEPSPGVP